MKQFIRIFIEYFDLANNLINCRYIHNGYKFVCQKKWFVIRSYTTKNENTYDYRIVTHTKFNFFINIHCDNSSLL